MKTNKQMMEEMSKNALNLFKIAQREYMKNPNDKDWKDLYQRSEKHYKSTIQSLKKFQ